MTDLRVGHFLLFERGGNVLPKINSAHGSDTRNIINAAIDSINMQGKYIQDLVAEGQLTEEQYGELIKYINGLIDRNELEETKASLGATVNSLIQQFNLKPLDDPIYIENLWDPEDTVPGTIDQNNGGIVEHASNRTSNFKRILPNQNYTYLRPGSQMIRVVYFDSNQNYIEGESWFSDGEPVTMKSPSNAAYQRTTLAISSSADYRTVPFYIVIGDYVPDGVKDGDAILYDGGFWENIPTPPLKPDSVDDRHLRENSIDNKHLKDRSVSIDKVDFINQSTNLADSEDITENKSIDGQTGELINSQTGNTSDFIPVKSNTEYTAKMWRYAFYNADKELLLSSGRLPDNASTITSPSNAVYLRVVFNASDRGKEQLNEGNILLPYEPFGHKLSSTIQTEGKEHEKEPEREYFLNTNFVPQYYLPNDNEDFGLMSNAATTTPYSEYTSNWQSLANSHPDYLTMNKIGEDESGQYDIYKISAKPTEITSPTNKERIKIIFITGIHGGEKTSQFATYFFFKDICENWMEKEALEFLRWNVQFEFIICASPYSFEDPAGRHNVNGVDINRNFEDGWTLGNIGDQDYGGTEPFSEAESRVIRDFIDENSDAVYFGDYHNHFSQDPAHMMWMSTSENAVGNDLIFDWGSTTIRKCSLSFHKRYDFPYIDSGMGYISQRRLVSPIATASSYARGVNIPACTFEAFHTLDVSSGLAETIQACTEFTGNYFLNIMRVMTQKYYK